MANVAAEAGAVLVADIAHIAGLIAGGAHPSPVGYAAAITTTTHKTLRGPRGAMIMSDAEHASALDRPVFPGLQGGPHNHTTAAIAVALHEAAQPEFRDYAQQVVKNAQALADALLKHGYDLVSGGTDNHYFHTFLRLNDVGWSFAEVILVAVVVMTTHCYYGYTASGGPVGVGEAVGRSMRLSLITIVVVVVLTAMAVYGKNPNFNLTV